MKRTGEEKNRKYGVQESEVSGRREWGNQKSSTPDPPNYYPGEKKMGKGQKCTTF